MSSIDNNLIKNNYAEDLQLATQISAKGDMSSFEELYKKYFKKVFFICLKMTVNGPDAEDLAQEVFIHIQRRLKSYRGDASLSSWLHRVTVNHVLMRLRKKSVSSELTTPDGIMPENYDARYINATSPVINRIALNDAIKQLAKGYRQIFLLHDLLGYMHEEIAIKLRISMGTSKSQLHKARLKLREYLYNGSLASVKKSDISLSKLSQHKKSLLPWQHFNILNIISN